MEKYAQFEKGLHDHDCGYLTAHILKTYKQLISVDSREEITITTTPEILKITHMGMQKMEDYRQENYRNVMKELRKLKSSMGTLIAKEDYEECIVVRDRIIGLGKESEKGK